MHQKPLGFSLLPYLIALILFGGLVFGASAQETTASSELGDSIFLDNFSYSGTSLDISGETSNARATFWKPDGTVVFVVGRYSNNVAAYELDDPWEISTATFRQAMALPGRYQHGLYFREYGERMWVYDRTSIWSFDLDEPWDITTISEGENTDLGDFVSRGHDIDFKSDGSMLFIDDRNTGAVFAIDLPVPWEVSSGSLSHTLDISHQQKAVRGIEFLQDGSVMILMDTGRDELLQYDLEEPYNILTARLVNTFDVSEQTHQGRGLSFNADLTSFYVTGRNEEKIFQYDLVPE